MKVEIEIPEPPDGWVFDGARIITNGERYLFNGAWVLWESVPSSFPVLVCVKAKPLWEPSPDLVAMLQPGWLARSRGGCWMWYKNRPRKNTELWGWVGDVRWLSVIRPELLPPDSIPWEQCCFKIGDPKE
jgi:hypothetical protein